MLLYRFEYRDAMAYDLTDLELFLQVVDQGSITQGAEHTHLSLASASARITAMEKALGAKLPDRCSDGLQSTLVVLAKTSATQTLLPTALADFLATDSDVDVELQERPSHEIVAAVTDGRAELGIIADTVDSARLARGETRRSHATADTKLLNTTEPNMRPYR